MGMMELATRTKTDHVVLNKKSHDNTLSTEDDNEYSDLVPCVPSDEHVSWQHDTSAVDCEPVLEVQDSFVSCVEGVSLQNDHEHMSQKPVSLVDRIVPDAGPFLSTKEASLIRLQAMEQNQLQQQNQNPLTTASETLNDIDLLNIILCGSDSGELDQSAGPVNSPGSSPTKEGEHKAVDARTGNAEAVGSEMACESGVRNSQCEVCLGEAFPTSTNNLSFVSMPCCGTSPDSKSLNICSACVILLTHRTSDGINRVGRCPRCRSWISIQAPDGNAPLHLDVSILEQSGKCAACNQYRSLIVDRGEVCDACFLGNSNPLLYECKQCHGAQRIPHPMYQYQPKPGEFGTKTWSCEGPCNFLTHWRIRHDQLSSIPVGDVPWPVADWKALARNRVLEARRELDVVQKSTCCIL